MKKTLFFLFSLILLLLLCSCAGTLPDRFKTPSPETEEKEEAPYPLPEGFTVGFGRREITPEVPVKLGSGKIATEIKDDLFATCIALSDGEQAVLLFAMDMKDVPTAFFDSAVWKIQKNLGIPEENIIVNATHTHNCPHTTASDNYNTVLFRDRAIETMVEIAEEALLDLESAKCFVGTGDTKGFAFVRRYLMADGSYKGIQSGNPTTKYERHETEADSELRAVRFERKTGKDIILVNWQAHAAHGADAFPEGISADFVSPLREGVESTFDARFAYFNGASGNLNLHSYVTKKTYSDYLDVGQALVSVVEEAIETEEEVSLGKLCVEKSFLPCSVTQDSPERQEQAKKTVAANAAVKDDLVRQFGFQSIYEAIAVNTRRGMEEETEVPLSAISFGEVAITANPFEMFDTSGEEIRDASPFKMTFTLAYSNGSFGYMPPDEIFPHGEYEVYVSRFEQGTAEKCVAEICRMLGDQKS